MVARQADMYQVMVRYEMPYHFNAGFKVTVSQVSSSINFLPIG